MFTGMESVLTVSTIQGIAPEFASGDIAGRPFHAAGRQCLTSALLQVNLSCEGQVFVQLQAIAGFYLANCMQTILNGVRPD